jgi:hypothetical protein
VCVDDTAPSWIKKWNKVPIRKMSTLPLFARVAASREIKIVFLNSAQRCCGGLLLSLQLDNVYEKDLRKDIIDIVESYHDLSESEMYFIFCK